MKKQDLTIPNLLSVARLILIPFIVGYYLRGYYIASSVLLIASALTDMFDGRIARRFNQISDLGKLLDPLADKLTMGAVVFSLTFTHRQVLVLMIVLVAKELSMAAGAAVLFKKGTRPSESKIFGKISTAALYTMLFIVMIGDIINEYTSGRIYLSPLVIWLMSIVCCILMLAALIQYVSIFVCIKNGTYNVETEKFEGEK